MADGPAHNDNSFSPESFRRRASAPSTEPTPKRDLEDGEQYDSFSEAPRTAHLLRGLLRGRKPRRAAASTASPAVASNAASDTGPRVTRRRAGLVSRPNYREVMSSGEEEEKDTEEEAEEDTDDDDLYAVRTRARKIVRASVRACKPTLQALEARPKKKKRPSRRAAVSRTSGSSPKMVRRRRMSRQARSLEPTQQPYVSVSSSQTRSPRLDDIDFAAINRCPGCGKWL